MQRLLYHNTLPCTMCKPSHILPPFSRFFEKKLGSGGDRIQWMKQGAAVGNVGEVLPAAETAEPELGP